MFKYVFAGKDVSVEFKRRKYEKDRYGSFLKLVTFLVLVLPGTGVPFAAMYLVRVPLTHLPISLREPSSSHTRHQFSPPIIHLSLARSSLHYTIL
jgi:hypothetical protein